MISATPLVTPSIRAKQPICTACAEGDHEQVLRSECCACACHGPTTLTADAEVAA
jgi:hypothetical protein